MEKELTISIPVVPGEDGLTIACKRGELFRNDSVLEPLYKQGYRVHNYAILNDKSELDEQSQPHTLVRVFLKK
jgi:hypothetical protein